MSINNYLLNKIIYITKTKEGRKQHFPIKKTQKRNHILYRRSNLQRTGKAPTSNNAIPGAIR